MRTTVVETVFAVWESVGLADAVLAVPELIDLAAGTAVGVKAEAAAIRSWGCAIDKASRRDDRKWERIRAGRHDRALGEGQHDRRRCLTDRTNLSTEHRSGPDRCKAECGGEGFHRGDKAGMAMDTGCRCQYVF